MKMAKRQKKSRWKRGWWIRSETKTQRKKVDGCRGRLPSGRYWQGRLPDANSGPSTESQFGDGAAIMGEVGVMRARLSCLNK